MTSFTLLITSPAFDSQSSHTAYEFCSAALKLGHKIDSIFFYHQGVTNSNNFSVHHSDEVNLHQLWKSLATEYELRLNVCVSAANRRGIITEQDAEEIDTTYYNLDKPFESVGLGELMTSMNASDRLVQF
ncbi:sulfurtransferase complex subunit TusD [Alteromonadaceae bacterium M269]|nr:sulfurtransferase complex subunit TusD [Alteromonadaceae bacterium M269]